MEVRNQYFDIELVGIVMMYDVRTSYGVPRHSTNSIAKTYSRSVLLNLKLPRLCFAAVSIRSNKILRGRVG